MYRWILFLCHPSLTAPAPTRILSVMFLISSPCFLCVFFTCSCPHQLSVGLRFSVQRLEDAGPKISFELQIHR